MADQQAKDLVLSYVVDSEGTKEEIYKPLQDALKNNYRVVDIIATPMSVARGSCGPVVITVLLSLTGAETSYKAGKAGPKGALVSPPA